MTTFSAFSNTPCLRQTRGWFGIALMVVSLFGGYRLATRVTEEIAPHVLSEILENSHRASDAQGRCLNRRHGAIDERLLSTRPWRAAAQPRTSPRRTEAAPRSYALANGLNAPLHC